jgi:hypothetical protein
MWSPRLRDWMNSFDASPFEESWFRSWLRPFDPPRNDKSSTEASNWLDKLRELFAPKDGTANKQS